MDEIKYFVKFTFKFILSVFKKGLTNNKNSNNKKKTLQINKHIKC